jgi:hypothetical protein
VPVVVNLKLIFELFGLYTTFFSSRNYWSLLDYHLMVSFGEKAKIKKAENLN